MKSSILLVALWLVVIGSGGQMDVFTTDIQKQAALALRMRVEASPRLPFHGVPLFAHTSAGPLKSGAVSGIALGKDGSFYEIQRGDESAPILHLNRAGGVLQQWGRRDYTIPHSIRIDPEGNVWTVDAASSAVIKYSPEGERLLTIQVGGQPNNGSAFNGATDIAFGPRGRLFITDGYGNARVLEYSPDGEEITQWGKAGTGSGEFELPHSLRIDGETIYVADRENGRIEKFDLDGHYIGEVSKLGRLYALKLLDGALWASMGSFDRPPGAAGGWLIKLDPKTGKIFGHLDIAEAGGGHALEVLPSGEPIITLGDHLLWFKKD